LRGKRKAPEASPMQFSMDAPSTASGTDLETRFVEVVFPELANHYGTLFGGNALNLMGKAAFAAATRHARHNVVMATSDKIEFHEPIPVGELVELIARVERAGRSSMTVSVEMIRENLLSGTRKPVVRGSFEMVAVDDEGRPIPIERHASRHSATRHLT
jgi:acyl-CoA hydrolase